MKTNKIVRGITLLVLLTTFVIGCNKKQPTSATVESRSVQVVTNSSPYLEHFEFKGARGEGDKPEGWQDARDDSSNTGTINLVSNGSAKITRGKVISDTITLDMDKFNTMRIVLADTSTRNFKVFLQEENCDKPIRIYYTAGSDWIRYYDLATTPNWTGVKRFNIILVVEDSAVTLDEIWIYNHHDDLDYFFEDFSGLPGQRWWDERDDSGNDAYMTEHDLGIARLTLAGDQGWGKVLSNTHTVDLNKYPILNVVVNDIDMDTSFKVLLKPKENYNLIELGRGNLGENSYNIPDLTGWQGSKRFAVVLVVESAHIGNGIVIDEVSIDGCYAKE